MTISAANAPQANTPHRVSAETRGMLYGFIGVLTFSLTLPATRLAVSGLDPVLVGLGRSFVAAPIAAFLLWRGRERRPNHRQIGSLAIVASGVILGFPLLSAIAMTRLPAAHGAILLGVLPLATAVAGALRAGDRPSAGFWLAGAAGSGLVIGYALLSGAGRAQPADLLLLLAVAGAAIGYAEGGRLARELGGWQVICWVVALAGPFLVLPMLWLIRRHGLAAPPRAWAGFAYVAVFSQLIGFFFWYKGLALGGVARVGQVQLAQIFLTIAASALLLGERIGPTTIAFALAVAVVIAIGRRMPVRRRDALSPPPALESAGARPWPRHSPPRAGRP